MATTNNDASASAEPFEVLTAAQPRVNGSIDLRSAEYVVASAIAGYGYRAIELLEACGGIDAECLCDVDLRPVVSQAQKIVYRARRSDSAPIVVDHDALVNELVPSEWLTDPELKHRLPEYHLRAAAFRARLQALQALRPSFEELETIIPRMVSCLKAADEERRAAKRGPNAPNEAQPQVRLTCANDIDEERVEWLWDGYIPRGMLTLLVGEPGTGKSTIALDVVARTTTGELMPGDLPTIFRASQPANVIIFTPVEEDASRATIPRLRAAGADLTRVHFVEGRKGALTLGKEDLDKLKDALVAHPSALVLVDPLVSYLPETEKRSDTLGKSLRDVLVAANSVASESGAAFLVAHHTRKEKGSALHAVAGSLGAVVGVARSVLCVGELPENEDENLDSEHEPNARALAVVKSSYSVVRPTLKYATRPHQYMSRKGIAISTSKVEWLGEAEGVRADDLTAKAGPRGRKPSGKLEAAMDALTELLADGPLPTEDVTAEVMRRAECGRRMVEDARKKLGIVARQVRTEDGKRVDHIVLMLPEHVPLDNPMGNSIEVPF